MTTDTQTLADETIATVKRWLAESATAKADPSAERLAGVLKDPRGLEFTIGFVDKVVRPEDLRVAGRNLKLSGPHGRLLEHTLRLGTYELIGRPDVPLAVVLDEAVELAKRFGSGDSSAFVNGVLDRVAQVVGRSASR